MSDPVTPQKRGRRNRALRNSFGLTSSRGESDPFPYDLPVAEIMKYYDVHEVRGFLPAEDPPQDLPEHYASWGEPQTIRDLILTGKIRERVRSLPHITIRKEEPVPMIRRVHSMMAMIMHAYLVGNALENDELLHEVPQNFSDSFIDCCQKIDHVPIITHSDIVLWNWKRKDPENPDLNVENLELLIGYLKSPSESWFYLLTTELEWRGGPSCLEIVKTLKVLGELNKGTITRADAAEKVTESLKKMESYIEACFGVLKRMGDGCDPSIFYKEVRPYVTGWERGSKDHPEGVVYQGSFDNQPQYLYGGSAGQSALVQVWDAFFGIKHKSPYLSMMQMYMPAPHRKFVIHVRDAKNPLRDFVELVEDKFVEVDKSFHRCISLMREFRTYHIQVATRYIIQQHAKNKMEHQRGEKQHYPTPPASPAASPMKVPKQKPITSAAEAPPRKEGVKGTGGTDLAQFLKGVRDETK